MCPICVYLPPEYSACLINLFQEFNKMMPAKCSAVCIVRPRVPSAIILFSVRVYGTRTAFAYSPLLAKKGEKNIP